MAGERKRATVLFCDLLGSTAIAEELDPEEYRELLESYLELVFEEVYRLEGVVNQLSGDGLMALFGAPISYEKRFLARSSRGRRDPARALSARAAGGRHRAQGTGGIGIHTGMVVAGTVGNDLKMDYTAIGDTTNLAARLQTLAAPASILVSDAPHPKGVASGDWIEARSYIPSAPLDHGVMNQFSLRHEANAYTASFIVNFEPAQKILSEVNIDRALRIEPLLSWPGPEKLVVSGVTGFDSRLYFMIRMKPMNLHHDR